MALPASFYQGVGWSQLGQGMAQGQMQLLQLMLHQRTAAAPILEKMVTLLADRNLDPQMRAGIAGALQQYGLPIQFDAKTQEHWNNLLNVRERLKYIDEILSKPPEGMSPVVMHQLWIEKAMIGERYPELDIMVPRGDPAIPSAFSDAGRKAAMTGLQQRVTNEQRRALRQQHPDWDDVRVENEANNIGARVAASAYQDIRAVPLQTVSEERQTQLNTYFMEKLGIRWEDVSKRIMDAREALGKAEALQTESKMVLGLVNSMREILKTDPQAGIQKAHDFLAPSLQSTDSNLSNAARLVDSALITKQYRDLPAFISDPDNIATDYGKHLSEANRQVVEQKSVLKTFGNLMDQAQSSLPGMRQAPRSAADILSSIDDIRTRLDAATGQGQGQQQPTVPAGSAPVPAPTNMPALGPLGAPPPPPPPTPAYKTGQQVGRAVSSVVQPVVRAVGDVIGAGQEIGQGIQQGVTGVQQGLSDIQAGAQQGLNQFGAGMQNPGQAPPPVPMPVPMPTSGNAPPAPPPMPPTPMPQNTTIYPPLATPQTIPWGNPYIAPPNPYNPYPPR